MDGEGLSPPRQAVMGTGGQVPRGPARLLLLAILAAACASCGGPHPPAGFGDAEDALALPPATLTARDLASRLVDLERLAVLPDNGERCGMFSSTSRSSRYDSASDRYRDWRSNVDGEGHLGIEDGRALLAQMEGPGCIWRMWSASPGEGEVSIYIDGSPEPVSSLPFRDYFDAESGPFPYPSLVYRTAAGGFNCYVPIPYQRSCRVLAEPGWGEFYQISYSSFPPGTRVPSWNGRPGGIDPQALAEVDRQLREGPGTDPAPPRTDAVTSASTVSIPPAGSAVAFEADGARAITGLRVRVHGLPARGAARWTRLRDLAIRMSWDGEARPAVWAPLGDFFGSVAGAGEPRALPTGAIGDGFYSYWYMPFASKARIMLENTGPGPAEVTVETTTAPLRRPVERLSRFHAKWHRITERPAREDRWPDHVLLRTVGEGRFVGLMLHVCRPVDGWDPRSKGGVWWWGEGDEKFFVDGEPYPSVFGTGTEDYFGYAWCDPTLFTRPFHGQVLNQGANGRGNISLYRFHVSDNVVFHRSLEAALEKYYGDAYARYSGVVYWYLASGGQDPYGSSPRSQLPSPCESPAAGRSEGVGTDSIP